MPRFGSGQCIYKMLSISSIPSQDIEFKRNLTIPKGHSCGVYLWKLTGNNPNLDLVNVNAWANVGLILSICTQDIERKLFLNNAMTDKLKNGIPSPYLTLLLPNMSCSVLTNSVDLDQLASEEANLSGSGLFVIKNMHFYQKPRSSNLICGKLEVSVAS